MIPKTIHQTWRNKKLPNILENIYSHNVNIHNNKEFEFKLWSHSPGDPDIDNFLKENYPKLFEIFKKSTIGVQKGDISRLAILYHYGGIYIDLDILCIKSFDNLLDFSSDKLFMAYEPPDQTIKVFNNKNYLCNAFIATPAKHPLLKIAIENVISNYNKYGDILFTKFDVFGGGFMQNIINTVPNISNSFELINTDFVFPINDPKFNDLSCSKKDWDRLKNGYYGSKAVLVHYWIHSCHEGKNILETFKCDDNISLHDNVFNFFCELYPSNAKLLCS